MSVDPAVESLSQEPKSAKPKVTPARIGLWCVLAIVLSLLLVEWQTRSNYQASYAKISKAFGDFDASQPAPTETIINDGVTESEIQNLIVGSPRHIRGEGNWREDTYTWRFLFRNYGFRVAYGVKPKAGEQEALSVEPVN